MTRPGDLYGPPIREASVRGGAGRFNWDDVKKDEKFRDTYIGHSLKAPVGRWQKGKDLQWYAKPRPPTAEEVRSARQEELKKIKEAEEEALAEALGFKVERKRGEGEGKVTKEELENVLKGEEGEGEEEVDGMKGLGFGSGGLRVGAKLPDGSVVQEQSVSVVDVKVESNVEEEIVSNREDREDREQKQRHRHRRRDHEEERSRHKHRHHQRDEERRPRSRSPHPRRQRQSDKDRHLARPREFEPEERREGRRGREHRERDDSPRRAYRDRRDRERSPYRDRRHQRRDFTHDGRD